MTAASKRIFILGGGAALGAHQVGAMKFLAEQGVVPDAFVASSIGVLNACVYASGGIPRLEEAWKFHGVPVVVIEPTEQWSGFGPFAVFQAYPRKNQTLMAHGYRDAKRVLAEQRRRDAETSASLRSVS